MRLGALRNCRTTATADRDPLRRPRSDCGLCRQSRLQNSSRAHQQKFHFSICPLGFVNSSNQVIFWGNTIGGWRTAVCRFRRPCIKMMITSETCLFWCKNVQPTATTAVIARAAGMPLSLLKIPPKFVLFASHWKILAIFPLYKKHSLHDPSN